MAIFVLIPGGHAGAWQYRTVAQILTKAGHEVFPVSLTGMGERIHLATPEINLETHILDVVNTILYNELTEVILMGYSYSGMVATGVAERIPERIKRLVYLDAWVPQDGQSASDLIGPAVSAGMLQMVNTYGNGWLIPHNLADPRYSFQPLQTGLQKLPVKNPLAAQLPRAFIYCTQGKGVDIDPGHIPIVQAAERARQDPRCQFFEIQAGHLVLETHSAQVAEILLKLA